VPVKRFSIPVSIGPGETILTRTPMRRLRGRPTSRVLQLGLWRASTGLLTSTAHDPIGALTPRRHTESSESAMKNSAPIGITV
jgi:hypothetical protein